MKKPDAQGEEVQFVLSVLGLLKKGKNGERGENPQKIRSFRFFQQEFQVSRSFWAWTRERVYQP